MKKIHKLIFILIFIFLNGETFSQKLFNNINISLGYSIQNQDKRLFDYPNQDEIIANQDTKKDHGIIIGLQSYYFRKNRFSGNLGLGYYVNSMQFHRPFDKFYFLKSENATSDEKFINYYVEHNINISHEIDFDVINNDKNKLIIFIPIEINFIFNKHVQAGEHFKYNRGKLEINDIGIYGGLAYQINSYKFSLTTRLFEIQKIDRILFPEFIYHHASSEFFNKKYETNQLFFLRFSITYTLFNK